MPSLNTPIRLAVIMAIGAILTAGLAACQSSGGLLSAGPVAPEKRIILQPNGPHQGEANTGELVVGYAYQLGPASENTIHVEGGVRRMTSRGDSLNIYLNFLDSAGRVIDKKILFASGDRRNVYFRRASTFDTTLPLPPETAAIAFSSYVKPSSSSGK
jgi:hypothetical protein